MTALPISSETSTADAVAIVQRWVESDVPAEWRAAAETIEVFEFMTAAQWSKERGGAAVRLEEVRK